MFLPTYTPNHRDGACSTSAIAPCNIWYSGLLENFKPFYQPLVSVNMRTLIQAGKSWLCLKFKRWETPTAWRDQEAATGTLPQLLVVVPAFQKPLEQ